jgi:hypothetical protein
MVLLGSLYCLYSFDYLHFEITFFKDDVAEPMGADAPSVQMHFMARCQYLQQIIISSKRNSVS